MCIRDSYFVSHIFFEYMGGLKLKKSDFLFFLNLYSHLAQQDRLRNLDFHSIIVETTYCMRRKELLLKKGK